LTISSSSFLHSPNGDSHSGHIHLAPAHDRNSFLCDNRGSSASVLTREERGSLSQHLLSSHCSFCSKPSMIPNPSDGRNHEMRQRLLEGPNGCNNSLLTDEEVLHLSRRDQCSNLRELWYRLGFLEVGPSMCANCDATQPIQVCAQAGSVPVTTTLSPEAPGSNP